MSLKPTPMTGALHEYLQRTWLRESPILQRMRAETAELGRMANMQTSAEQGQLMAFLIELIGARRVLELGTFTGYSALVMAAALPPGGRLITCDVNEEWTATARRYWEEAGVAGRIDLRLGPALETLEKLLADGQADSFDVCFIDADKENIETYYEQALRLVRPGGLILLDNVFWGGTVVDPAASHPTTFAVRRINERVRDDERVSLAIVPIADGLTLARRRV